eukprot:Rhum_TRINITY_DN22949_c0_g2::Rhum_TRINITY_DN22949_c0_g2_i1::g.176622::m.176622
MLDTTTSPSSAGASSATIRSSHRHCASPNTVASVLYSPQKAATQRVPAEKTEINGTQRKYPRDGMACGSRCDRVSSSTTPTRRPPGRSTRCAEYTPSRVSGARDATPPFPMKSRNSRCRSARSATAAPPSLTPRSLSSHVPSTPAAAPPSTSTSAEYQASSVACSYTRRSDATLLSFGYTASPVQTNQSGAYRAAAARTPPKSACMRRGEKQLAKTTRRVFERTLSQALPALPPSLAASVPSCAWSTEVTVAATVAAAAIAVAETRRDDTIVAALSEQQEEVALCTSHSLLHSLSLSRINEVQIL